MNTYLAELRIQGIKNIDNMITLKFYNTSIPKHFEINNSNIKAIYGENGVGKSAIIHAVEVYKNLITRNNYLVDSYTIDYLNEIVNKKMKCFSIESTFIVYDDEDQNTGYHRFQHKIEVVNHDGAYTILNETMYEIKSNYANGKKLMYAYIDGMIQHIEVDESCKQKIIEDTKNMLTQNSICAQILTNVNILTSLKKTTSCFKISVTQCFIMLFNTEVVLSDADKHIAYISRKQPNIMPFITSLESVMEDSTLRISIGYMEVDENEQKIKKTEMSSFKSKIQRLTKFIKIFKNDLIDIEIETKEVEDYFYCTKYFVYHAYRIHSEFESTGIKKLIKLFSAFESFEQGDIVFIDEMDANLHDVYLCKLLEFFRTFAKGQLCFTTHNLGPMDVLKGAKHSIDFLTNDSMIVSWKKSGHYSVKNLYKEGMIKNSPFNVQATDFLGVFSESED